MALEDKVLLMNRFKNDLSSVVTAKDQETVLTVLNKIVSYFDVTQVEMPECGEPDDCLNAYLSNLEISGRSPKTIELYRYTITKMMKFVNVMTKEITVYHLREFIASEKARGIADSTLEGNRQTISAYFHWLHREGLIRVDPSLNLAVIKCAKKVKTVYSDADIERLKSYAISLRDKTIVSFLASTGCRVSELCGLDRSDIDLIGRECVVHGKGNKERTVYFDDITTMYLKEYLESRKDLSPCLFTNRLNQRLKPGGVRWMLNRLNEKAQIGKVFPHKFRTTFATNKVAHGMPVQELASLMGHEKIDTTMKYVVMNKSLVKNSYQRYT